MLDNGEAMDASYGCLIMVKNKVLPEGTLSTCLIAFSEGFHYSLKITSFSSAFHLLTVFPC